MSTIEIDRGTTNRDISEEDRPCHIATAKTNGVSLCGLRHINQGQKYHAGRDWQEKRLYCQANHQMCVVCLAEYERIRGHGYFEF